MDPTRRHRSSRWDYVYVAAGILVALAGLAWAIWG